MLWFASLKRLIVLITTRRTEKEKMERKSRQGKGVGTV
jgi:hypothetical protein